MCTFSFNCEVTKRKLQIKLFVNIYCRKFQFESCKWFSITAKGVNFSCELLKRTQSIGSFDHLVGIRPQNPFPQFVLSLWTLVIWNSTNSAHFKLAKTIRWAHMTNSKKIILSLYLLKNFRCMVPSLIIFTRKKIRVKSVDF